MHNAIQISGGIDSLALLYHLRPIWNDSLVMWCDTGAAYDDVAALMDKLATIVPHFLIVRGDQPRVVSEYGHPVDVVPVSHTRAGEFVYGAQPIAFQSYLDCCARSRFAPLAQAVRECGARVVYRGQRDEDKRRARFEDGFIDEHGVRYWFPLAAWTRERVFDYVRGVAPELIPAYYAAGEKTSRDCWSCTAYRDDNAERVAHLPAERRDYVQGILNAWRAVVRNDMQAG